MFVNRKLSHRLIRPHGFTLVELLVALGLVALLMLMFAQVFQVATATMSTQRGIMENDQRARMLTTIIGSDLNHRTMRSVMPFQPGEQDYPMHGPFSFRERQGFLSVSENDPNNDADDVLHFTAFFQPQKASDELTSTDAEVYYGKAAPLYYPQSLTVENNLGQIISIVQDNQNQPEVDDGSAFLNFTASSHTAEVVFFLRNGNLYRRILLIREPLNPSLDHQPKDGATGGGSDMFDPTLANPYYSLGRDFWRDFDFSAHYQSPLSGARLTGGGVGVNPLDNGSNGGAFPIGMPSHRFGHDPISSNPNLGFDNAFKTADDSIGNPREYVDSLFIGRFTQQETSNSQFNFPHSLSSAADDHDSMTGLPSYLISDGIPPKFLPDVASGTSAGTVNPPTVAIAHPLTDSDGNGVVDQYDGDPMLAPIYRRRGEDILMSNVHSFDVKVWDEIMGDYVDIGHAQSNGGQPGDFNQINNRRTSYGPQASNNRMFDTWHPHFNANNRSFYVDSLSAPVDMDTGDVSPFLPRVNPTIHPTWQPSTPYNIGDIVVPSDTTDRYFDTVFYYQCTANTTGMATGQSAATEPTPWPAATGIAVTDNELTWTAVYNPAGILAVKRLKSLKITIRYLDVSSDQMRQVTIIQSLID